MSAINRTTLLERCMGMPSILEGVLTQFHDLGKEMIENVETQIDAHHWENVVRSAHSLKGAAGSISADALQKAAAEMEANARNADADACNILRPVLRREMERCLEEIPEIVRENPVSVSSQTEP